MTTQTKQVEFHGQAVELKKVWEKPSSHTDHKHHLCPGCGEAVAIRLVADVIDDMDLREKTVYALGVGCHLNAGLMWDIDYQQCLHGRAPAVATGMRRVLPPDHLVFTFQGDGDMVSEGLHEIMHCAARGENITAILLNNAAFGETGGHMTAATLVGQRTKDTLGGRDPALHGVPIKIADIVAQLGSVAYVARGTVNSPGAIMRSKKLLRRAFDLQLAGAGFSFVEILTMCPSGWFVEPEESLKWIDEKLVPEYPLGVLKETN